MSYNVIIVTPDVSLRFPTGIFCDYPLAINTGKPTGVMKLVADVFCIRYVALL
jgi:hypothetical protein